VRLRLALVSLSTLVATGLGAAAAHAVVGGTPDGNDHPSTGGLVADHAYSDGTWIYCSGSLISPTVFLTAAHCGEGGDGRVRVTFSSAYHDGDTTYAGTFHADPAYPGPQGDPHDIAVVVLDKAVKGITPVTLPRASSLSNLKSGVPVVGVGYGAYQVTNEPGGHHYLYNDIRMEGTGSLNSVDKNWLRVSENSAQGWGGGCFGDSGGPNFIGNVEVGTTITGDAICRSTNTAYRLDTAVARDFLGQYVALP
jgi:secreted trypsin-like serine protease